MQRVGISVLLAWVLSASQLNAEPSIPALTATIDRHLAVRWTAVKVTPSAPADDATWLRRIHLDMVGRIPTVAEVREFLADPTPDKRTRLIARLLDTPAHARHAATFWRREWIPQADLAQSLLADEVDGWIATQLHTNRGYDQLARDLLTATRNRKGTGAPFTFITASELLPENLAANTTRAFLGINLDCAQCHDHPFARWTRDQFWETAAFFVRPKEKSKVFKISIPNTKKSVRAKFLNETEPTWPEPIDTEVGRIRIADWVTAKQNPYFARNAVNRLWAQLFGTGLVEPLDDLSGENPASHPELLNDLAAAFIENRFQLKPLITAIVQSKAYQLSSIRNTTTDPDPRWFARSQVRGLTGEQLYDSLRAAAGLPADRSDLDSVTAQSERRAFTSKFRIERGGTAQRSILQTLTLMNGKMTVGLTDPSKTPTLQAIADAPFLNDGQKIDAIFFAALSRKPTDEERLPLVNFLTKQRTTDEVSRALSDIFWAILNSSEFNTNH